ncbi:MAG: hypothetical protein R2699_16130 [Acidimicrobiales bacterium]
MPQPARAGDPVGLRHHPPRLAHGHPAAAARVLRRLPRAGRRLRLAAAPVRRLVRALHRLPGSRAGGRRGRVPDHLVVPPTGQGSRRSIEKLLFELRPGVTEVFAHPAIDTPELRAFAPDWSLRVDDHHFLTHDSGLRKLIDRAGVTLISYRELRDAMRAG